MFLTCKITEILVIILTVVKRTLILVLTLVPEIEDKSNVFSSARVNMNSCYYIDFISLTHQKI